MGQLGISLNPVKAIKKAGRGIAKGTVAAGKGVATGAKTVGKVAVKIATLPLAALEQIIVQVSIPIGRTLCSVPKPLLNSTAASVGVSANTVSIFCTALSLRKMSDIKRYLPDILKIAVQLGATGAFPAIGPVLAAARAVPGIQFVPLLKILVQRPRAVAQQPTYYTPPQPTNYTPAYNSMPAEEAPYIPPDYNAQASFNVEANAMMGLGISEDLSTGEKVVAGILIGALVGVTGYALYCAFRD